MTSRDPDELQDSLESIDFPGDVDTLSELRAEARDTVDCQSDTLNDIDTKASKILRLNILLIGILVSVLSVAAQNGGGDGASLSAVDSFINIYMEIGVSSLVLSTAFAAMTYTASELDVGVSSNNLFTILDADLSRKDVEELLVKNYIIRINFNRSTNIRNIPLIQLTIFFVVSAVVFFTLGVYDALFGSVPCWLLGAALLLLIGVLAVSGVITQSWRAIKDIREWR